MNQELLARDNITIEKIEAIAFGRPLRLIEIDDLDDPTTASIQVDNAYSDTNTQPDGRLTFSLRDPEGLVNLLESRYFQSPGQVFELLGSERFEIADQKAKSITSAA